MEVNFYTTIITNNGTAEYLADEICFAPLHCLLELYKGEDTVKRYEVVPLSFFARVTPIEKAPTPIQNGALKAACFVLLMLKIAASIILVVPFTIIGTVLKNCTQNNEENRIRCSKLKSWFDPKLRKMFQEVQDNNDRRELEDKNAKLLAVMRPDETQLTAPAHLQQKKDPMIVAFTFLNIKDLPTAAIICKRWRSLVADDIVWKELTKRYHITLTSKSSLRTPVTSWLENFGSGYNCKVFGGYENILALPVSPSIPGGFPIIFSGISMPNSFFPLLKPVYRGEYIQGEASLVWSNVRRYAVVRVMCTYASQEAAKKHQVLVDDQNRGNGVFIFDGQYKVLYMYQDAYYSSKPEHFEFSQSGFDPKIEWYQELLSGKTCPGQLSPEKTPVCTYQLWTEQFHNEWNTWAQTHGRDRCSKYFT